MWSQRRLLSVLVISLLTALTTPVVLSSLKDRDVSGDRLEHFNVHPLTREITLASDPVQAVHIALYGSDKVRITWLNPAQFQSANLTFKPGCRYGLSSRNLGYFSSGFAYSYEAGMFRLTLNTAILDLAVLPDVYTTVFYSCGDPGYGWSIVYHFTYCPPTIVNQELSPFSSKFGDFLGRDIGANKDKSHISRTNTEDLKLLNQNILHKRRHDVLGTGTGNNVVQMDQETPSSQSVSGFPNLIVLIADMGVTHAADTMSGIGRYIEAGWVHLVVHAGDISYADNFSEKKHNNSYIWVEYMNEMNRINPWVPYMTCPGNHEAQFDFAAYLNWLPMPHQQSHSPSHFWYSFDYMGVHFLSMSTEHPFDPQSEQFRFMQQDLVKANLNRDSVPWLIVIGHRPLYCTSLIAEERCEKEAVVYRSYLEDLFYAQKVDVYLCGHNHNYERTYPVYRGNATQKNFNNPLAPIYIVDGAAGNPEPNDPSYRPHVDWRAYVYGKIDNGFLLAEATSSQLRFRYIRSHDRLTVDSFTITRSAAAETAQQGQ